MPEVEAVDPSRQPDWDQTLLKTPGSSFFHTAAWAAALSDAYRYEPLYLTLRDGTGLHGLLPVMEVDSPLTGRRGVSLPFTDYCEPIAADPAQFQELFAAAVALGRQRRWRYLELRCEIGEIGDSHQLSKLAKLGTATNSLPAPFVEIGDSHQFFPKIGGCPQFQFPQFSEWHYAHALDLETTGDRHFSDATLRNIRKARKQNLEVTLSTAPEALRSFCRLNALTRRRHGIPPQPRRFFQAVQDRILSRNMGFIVLASLRGTAIAAGVYFTFGEQLIYKYGASDRAFQQLRANNLVMGEAIRWGLDHGYRSLCLGRTEPGNDGLRRFKAGWGARERIIRYYRYDLRKDAFTRTPQAVRPVHRRFFGRLPVPILNLLGRLLYRHMG